MKNNILSKTYLPCYGWTNMKKCDVDKKICVFVTVIFLTWGNFFSVTGIFSIWFETKNKSEKNDNLWIIRGEMDSTLKNIFLIVDKICRIQVHGEFVTSILESFYDKTFFGTLWKNSELACIKSLEEKNSCCKVLSATHVFVTLSVFILEALRLFYCFSRSFFEFYL